MSVVAQALDVEPLSPNIGAVVKDFDARRDLSADETEAILQLLYTYKVLFFRGLHLNDEEHCRFAYHFGEPHDAEFVVRIPGHPGLSELDTVSFFHSDLQQMELPPKFSLLRLDSAPPVGGDTMWVDLVNSYEDLSQPMRDLLETLTAEYSFARYEGDGSAIAQERVDRNGGDFQTILGEIQPHDHPVVRVIPQTGRKNYWVSRAFTRKINGLTQAESRMLLEYLWTHQLQPQYAMRWRWQNGDIAFWDHRTTFHSGVRDFGDFKRLGRRCSVGHEAPVAVWAAQ